MKRGGLVFLCGGFLLAQQGAVIQTETRVVLIDALVTGKNGAYVRDLNAKDFRVWEDNNEQTIRSVTLESSNEQEPKSLVLFFDQTSMEVPDQAAARRAASAFIDAATAPNRRMALMVYDGALRIARNFTDNAGRLKDALPAPAFIASPADKSTLGTGPVSSATADVGARHMIRSLANLATSLNVLPGRKIVVLFSGKLQSNSAQMADLRDAIDASNRSGVAIYPVDVRPVSEQAGLNGPAYQLPGDRPPARGGRAGPQGDSDSTIGSQPDSSAASQQILFRMASGTGGFVVTNSADLIRELERVAREQDGYYVLSYSPANAKEGSKDGACHSLKVKVDRRGTAVRARAGYCTSKPVDLLAGTNAEKDLEKRAAAGQPGSLAASIELPWFYVAPGVARVHAVMEIAPGAAAFAKSAGKLHAEINLLALASAADGDVRARFSDTLKFDFDNEAQVAAWKKQPLHYEKDFRIAPGRYNLAVTFADGAGGKEGAAFGRVEKPLNVEEWSGHDPSISEIALSREMRPAADLGLGLAMEDRTPLTFEDRQIIPSGSNRFRKSEPGFFYFEVYGFDPASLRVGIRITDRASGKPVLDTSPMKLPPAKNNKPAIAGASRLPLDSLAEGAYRLEVSAVDDGGKQVRRTADFEVRGPE